MSYSVETDSWDVVANINYFAADGSIRQPGIFKKPIHGERTATARSMTIRDVRPIVNQFKINANGFEFVKLPAKERYMDDEAIEHEYYPEVSAIVQFITGATTVHVFNHFVRRKAYDPSGHPHVDYCGVPELLEGTKEELRLPPNIAKLYNTSSHFCYVNSWRPIQTVKRGPLALADATQCRTQTISSELESFLVELSQETTSCLIAVRVSSTSGTICMK